MKRVIPEILLNFEPKVLHDVQMSRVGTVSTTMWLTPNIMTKPMVHLHPVREITILLEIDHTYVGGLSKMMVKSM